ncbi:hypothetical protein HHI36_016325 [Cryptolaemus montrouzieri]|uniref:Uncharacterized protein n=1 Tax=Cryptolaemus montrouzieri TaxID=559131 RepID=A0ABD2NK58_9CUCU
MNIVENFTKQSIHLRNMYRETTVLLIFMVLFPQTFAKSCVDVKIENEESIERLCCSLSDIEIQNMIGYTIITFDSLPYFCRAYNGLEEFEIEEKDMGFVKQRSTRDAQQGQRNGFQNPPFVSQKYPHFTDTSPRCPQGQVRDIAGRCTYRFYK